MGQLKLYNYFRSSSAYRVRIALNLKQLPYDYIPVHLLNNGGEQKTSSYKSLNSMAQVPTLIDDQFNLGQSMAILMYLDEKFPKNRLFPSELMPKARVIQLCEIINSGIQPLQNLSVLQELENRYKADQNEKDSWSQYWIHRGFRGLEDMLQTTAGTFSMGGEITAADCFLIPQIFVAKRFHVKMDAYPILDRINQTCLSLKAFQDAHPDRQPDTPKA